MLRVQFQQAALGLPCGQPGGWPSSRGGSGGRGMESNSGREIWPEVVEETTPLPAMPSSRPCCFHLPEDSQVWPRIPGGAGGGRRLCSQGAGPAQRGQEARTPGIVSSSRSPASAREEVLPGALRWCLPRCIVEQETGLRGSWAVEEGAPDAETTRACRDKWRRSQ